MKKKYPIVACITLAFSLLLCSCYDYSDIESELIVAGIAFDIVESDTESPLYLVTAEVVTLNSSSSDGNHSALIRNTGITPLAAIRGMTACSSKKLYFGHCKLIVLSREISELGISSVLDIAFRDREIRPSINVVVTKGCRADELLSVSTVTNSIKSYEIVQTVKTVAEKYGTAASEDVNGILNSLYYGSGAAKVPYFTVRKDSENKTSYFLDGIALFSDDSLCGYIPSDNSVFCTLASGEFKKGTITCVLPCANTPFSFNITESSANIDLEKSDGGALLTIKIDLTVSFPELPDSICYNSVSDADIISEQIERYISDNVFCVVKDTIDRYGLDIFNFIPKLAVVYPRYLETFGDTRTFLKTLKIKTEISVSPSDSGLSGKNFNSENIDG